MFFGYPIAAVQGNWLHDCLVEIVTTIHTRLDTREEIASWPDLIPSSYRAHLHSRTGLRDRVVEYTTSARNLNAAQRAQVLECLHQQNAIAGLLGCTTNCARLRDLPTSIQDPVSKLFEFAFGLLTPLGIRDQHYAVIYNASQRHVCPFCCSEYFDAPGAPREDYDHYLASSIYPFAAANLRNLTPMGMKCNQRYKIAGDILRDNAGNRRRSFDPYAVRELRISLENSVPFAQDDGETPEWHIDFVPDSTECATWDSVFQIRTRLTRDVLDPLFHVWLGVFAGWYVRHKDLTNLNDGLLIAALGEYAQDAEAVGFTAREFLCGPVFRMMERRCANGDNRLIQFIRDLISQGVLPPRTAP